MRFRITAPAGDFSGDVAGVVFTRGQATADRVRDAAALSYFRRKGYTVVPAEVEPEQAEPVEPTTTSVESEPTEIGRPSKSEQKAVWQEYARGCVQDADELDAIDDMTKEQLIEKYGQQGETA